MDYLIRHIEALIFCAKQPVSLDDLKQCLSEMFDADVPEDDIRLAVNALQKKYDNEEYAFEPVMIGGGFQFLTKPAYQSSISILLKQHSKKRLSGSALETLAIIAYRQPVTKSEIERIRGVNSDYSVQKLLDKELILIQGKSDAVGRPLIYGTSDSFMDYFGINDLSELPTLKDIQTEQNEVGQVSE